MFRFGTAEEIELSTRRVDGTLRGYVPIWAVAGGDGDLYVRSYRGGDSYLRPMLAEQAIATTLRVRPKN